MTEVIVQLGFGEIVSWKLPKECPYADITAALLRNNLPVSVAHDLQPRNAFIRGVRQLEEKRIIKKLHDDKTEIKFQLNKIVDQVGGFDYPFEAEIVLDKSSGAVQCPVNYKLQVDVQNLLDSEMGRRTSGDITKIVQTLFTQHGGDLIPIRDQGGAYFVPAEYEWLVTNVRGFLGDIGGTLKRFGGLSGEDTRSSLADSIGEHFETMLGEFNELIVNMNSDTTERVRERRSDQLEQLRTKLSSYRDLLKMTAEEIDAKIDQAEAEMFKRLNEQTSHVGHAVDHTVVDPTVVEPEDVHDDEDSGDDDAEENSTPMSMLDEILG